VRILIGQTLSSYHAKAQGRNENQEKKLWNKLLTSERTMPPQRERAHAN